MKKLSDELKYFLSGSVFMGIGSIYSLVVPVIIIPYIIKIVGLSNYGLSVIAFSITLFMSLVVDFGYNVSGVNSLSKAKTDAEKGIIIMRTIQTKSILFILVSIIFLFLLFFIPYFRTHYVLFLLSASMAFSSIFNLSWALQGLQNMKLVSGMNILSKTIYVIGVIVFVKVPKDYVFVNMLNASGIIVSGIFSIFIIQKKTPIKFIKYSFKDLLLEIKTSGHYFISNASVYLSTNIFPVILSLFVKNDIVGVFSIVEKLYNLIRTIFIIYLNLMLPRISGIVENSVKLGISTIKKTYIFVVVFVSIEIIALTIFSEEIIMYFTEKYVKLSIELLRISFLGILFVLFNCPVYLILVSLDRKKEIMKVFLIGPSIGILTCFLLSKLYGVYGAVISIVIVEFFYAIALNIIFYVRKDISRKRA